MKILGIGNAIVDVICKVDDDYISQNGLTKSTMKLIFDENEFKNLLKESTNRKNSLRRIRSKFYCWLIPIGR